MISFIVIGKNIAFTISKCLHSIELAVKENNVSEYEVIYVDSKSTDDTVEIVKQFKGTKILKITGICNAAIARNIGAKEANGTSLFFLDGDMELCSEFLRTIYDDSHVLKYRFVSGDLQNYFYDQKNKFLRTAPYFKSKLEKDRTEYTTGGFFVIDSFLWSEVGGMRSCFRRGQDLDLGLRLSKKGNYLLRKKELMANHHTISYFEKKRFVNMISKGDYLYPGVLLRKNFFNMCTWKVLKKTQSSALFLGILLILSLLISPYLIFLYFIVALSRSILKKDKQERSFLFHFFSFLCIDVTVLIGFFFFYPKSQPSIYTTIS